MKKSILSLSILLSGFSFSQNVGINSTGAAPATSAALDIDMAAKGVLLPRLALTATNLAAPVTAPATSLLIYNTATSGTGAIAVSPGYYYWDGAKWVRFIGGQNDYWRVGANVSDVNQLTATGFIGTTTNNHMDYVTNGIVRGRFSNLGEFFVGTTNTTLPGDLMNGVGNVTFPFALNGYTTFNGAASYGLRQAGAFGVWGSIQGETDPSIAPNNSGVSGLAGSTTHRGVIGQRPTGGAAGAGFGGLFLNDLGYTGGFFNLSDERFKINIKPLNGGIELVKSIKLYSYNMDTTNFNSLGSGNLHYGVMAQELKMILPDLVELKNVAPIQSRSGEQLKGPEMDVNMVNYLELIPIALQAIKEQQLQIEELKKELNKIKQAQGEIIKN